MPALGKLLIILGIMLIIVGFAFVFGDKIPFLGRLPGDVYVKKERFSFYFPLTTSIMVSVILSLIFWLFRK